MDYQFTCQFLPGLYASSFRAEDDTFLERISNLDFIQPWDLQGVEPNINGS